MTHAGNASPLQPSKDRDEVVPGALSDMTRSDATRSDATGSDATGSDAAVSTALIEIAVPVEGELVEPVFELFERHGGGAVIETRVRGAESGYDDARPQTWVRTYLPAGDAEARLRVEIGLWHLGQIYPLPEAIVRELAEANWAEAWKAHYTPQRVGPFLVVPSWIDADAALLADAGSGAGDGGDAPPTFDAPAPIVPHVIRLDPGMAFGTGQHPTTRLCLIALAEHVRDGDRVLDVGVGSGILAIGAGLAGAGEVVGVDIDPRAAETARANAAANGVSLDARAGSLDALATEAPALTPFDLVVANILAPTVIELAGGLADWTRPGGSLIASGILAEQASDVAAALCAAGFAAPDVRIDGDWVALVAVREAESASDAGAR